MSNEPLLETNIETNIDNAGPVDNNQEKKKKKLSAQGLQDDVKGCLSMGKYDVLMVVMNEKNWIWLFFYLLACLVGLLFLYHEAEGHTPLLTVARALIAIFGLMAAGYTIYLGAKLEEQIEKFQFENAVLEGNNRKMSNQLDKFEQLRVDLQKFSEGKDEKFEETFKNVTDMFDSVKETLQTQKEVLKDQRQETMTKFFYDFAFMDGDETMSAKEFLRASKTAPKYLKEAWSKYKFETFPRASGRSSSDPITIDEFQSFLEKVLSETRERNKAPNEASASGEASAPSEANPPSEAVP